MYYSNEELTNILQKFYGWETFENNLVKRNIKIDKIMGNIEKVVRDGCKMAQICFDESFKKVLSSLEISMISALNDYQCTNTPYNSFRDILKIRFMEREDFFKNFSIYKKIEGHYNYNLVEKIDLIGFAMGNRYTGIDKIGSIDKWKVNCLPDFYENIGVEFDVLFKDAYNRKTEGRDVELCFNNPIDIFFEGALIGINKYKGEYTKYDKSFKENKFEILILKYK